MSWSGQKESRVGITKRRRTQQQNAFQIEQALTIMDSRPHPILSSECGWYARSFSTIAFSSSSFNRAPSMYLQCVQYRINKQKITSHFFFYEIKKWPSWVENILGENNDRFNVAENLLFFVLPFAVIGVVLPPRFTWRRILSFPCKGAVADAAGVCFLLRFVWR